MSISQLLPATLIDHPDAKLNLQGGSTARTPSGLHVQYFTSSGTFTPATGVTKIFVECVGGGGGGAIGSVNSGGLGGGGGYSMGTLSVTPGVGVTVTVGAAGTAGTSSVAGGTGGTTTVSTISATGGVGGAANVTSNSSAGGTGSGGLLNVSGQTGTGLANGGAPAQAFKYGISSNTSSLTSVTTPANLFGTGSPPVSPAATGSGGLVVIMWNAP